VSYSYSPTPADGAEVLQKVSHAMSSGEMPTLRARYVELERLEKRLGFAVKTLRQTRQEITGPLLYPRRPPKFPHLWPGQTPPPNM
jgi:hypothetical protein